MITVITRWEKGHYEAQAEWARWRQLRGAFGIDRFIFTPVMPEFKNVAIEQYDNMTTCLLKADAETPRVFLEPTGYNSVYDMPKGDITLILSNASRHNMEHAKVNETYQIMAPRPTDLFGTDAAAIALAVRYGQ